MVEDGSLILRATFGDAAQRGVPIGGEQATAWPVLVHGHTVGWVKRHRNATAARREAQALSRFGAVSAHGVRVVTALHLEGRWIAVTHAPGRVPTCADISAWHGLGGWLGGLRQLDVPADPVTLSAALHMRWGRAAEVVGVDPTPPREALDRLASFGRVWAHRDLRPDNLRWGGGVLWVLDAGQARPDHTFADSVVVAATVGEAAARLMEPRIATAGTAWTAARRLHALTDWAWAVRHADPDRATAARAVWSAIG